MDITKGLTVFNKDKKVLQPNIFNADINWINNEDIWKNLELCIQNVQKDVIVEGKEVVKVENLNPDDVSVNVIDYVVMRINYKVDKGFEQEDLDQLYNNSKLVVAVPENV